MAKRRRYYYSKNEDYLFWCTGTVTKIIELNKEYEKHFKTVFSLEIPREDDERFKTCISWERQLISVGDMVVIKGRYLENGFLVKKLSILRKAQADAETACAEQDVEHNDSDVGAQAKTSTTGAKAQAGVPSQAALSSEAELSIGDVEISDFTGAKAQADGNIQDTT